MRRETMRLLVSGGCGFIGSRFILDHLEKKPEDSILCLDKLTYAANRDIPDIARSVSDKFDFVKGDIADRDCVFSVFESFRPDAVVNFAAETHVDRSIEDPMPFVASNVNGTATLLDACLKYGTPRFHQVSTDEVYGEYNGSPDKGFDEGAPLCPSSPYAATKAASDMLALSYFRTYGLFVTVTRGANTYGERQYPEKLIPKTIRLALDKEPVPVMGDGSARRDWIFVGDHARAIEYVLEKGTPGEIYNVPGESELANIDTVKRVLSLVGADSELVRFVPERLGHDARYLINGEKLKDLGFSHEVTFDKGLEYTVKRYLEIYRCVR